MSRISKEIESILNTQIANEMNSSKLYRAMANCLEFDGWVGASKLWKKYAREENDHAEKIMEFMQDRDCLPQIPATAQQPKEFEGIKGVINKSNEHEMSISANWKKIAGMAMKESDLMTFDLAQNFIREQIEEEAKTIYWVDRLSMYELTKKPLGDLDEEMEGKA